MAALTTTPHELPLTDELNILFSAFYSQNLENCGFFNFYDWLRVLVMSFNDLKSKLY